MKLGTAARALTRVPPRVLKDLPLVRAFNTKVATAFGREWFFDSTWSFSRGYRFNFKRTWPFLYLAGDKLTATVEIGPRNYADLLVPLLSSVSDPYLYVDVRVTAPVLDLTNLGVRRRLGVTIGELTVPTEVWDEKMDRGIPSVTHQIGQIALNDGRFGGILYPSFPAREFLKMGKKVCLAVFMDKAHVAMAKPSCPGTLLKVVDDGDVLSSMGLRI